MKRPLAVAIWAVLAIILTGCSSTKGSGTKTAPAAGVTTTTEAAPAVTIAPSVTVAPDQTLAPATAPATPATTTTRP